VELFIKELSGEEMYGMVECMAHSADGTVIVILTNYNEFRQKAKTMKKKRID